MFYTYRWRGADVSCGRHVRLTEGDTLYLRWQTGLGPLAQCAVAWPNGTETVLPEPSSPPQLPLLENDATAQYSSSPAYAGDGYLSGQCGLRADNATAGVRDWTLKATSAVDGRRHAQYTSRVTCVGKLDRYYPIYSFRKNYRKKRRLFDLKCKRTISNSQTMKKKKNKMCNNTR